MTIELVKLQLIPRTIEGVQLTADNMTAVKDWVQSKLPFHQVVGTADRLYLPSVGGMLDILEPGDWVLYDPSGSDFRGAENDAIEGYYLVVEAEVKE